jgi:PEP-CTERM motif
MKLFLAIITLITIVLPTKTFANVSPVAYSFDFEITSDTYRGQLSGPLFTSGTKGTGIATFFFQPISEAIDSRYIKPFTVQIQVEGRSFTLIDLAVMEPNPYSRKGITVQDQASSDATYDTILFEGFSGPVFLDDDLGNLVSRNLYTQLGLLSLPDTIHDSSLSQLNVDQIANTLIETTFNIQDTLGGQVNGAISNFTMVSAVPEPDAYAIMLVGLGLIGFARRKRTS